MSEATADFDAWERLVGHSAATRRRRRGTLDRFQRFVTIWPADVQGERRLIERWLATFGSTQTRASYLADLHAFFSWAFDRELVAYDPTVGIRAPKIAQRRPTPLTRAEVARAYLACHDSQDRLALDLGLYAGLRVSEIAHLEHGHVDLVGRVLHVRHGKGGKDRAVPIADELADTLHRCGHTMRTNVGDGVSKRVRNVFRRAGVDHRPHDLRATFATELIRGGVDLVTVQHYLGHSSVATTQRYVLPDDSGVELVNRLSFAHAA